tara:strand:- start:554 stop:1282 length:729 start_codon:yes stop_codon:yes gene_type:complete
MKTVILAGGFGTRLSEYTETIPKPMVEVNNKPILERIMNIYVSYGLDDFYLALGYKSEFISSFFKSSSDNNVNYKILDKNVSVNLIDTGLNTMTGGRVKRLEKIVGNESFMLTYGDGVSDINIEKLIDFHNSHNKMVTVTAVRPPARFGALKLNGNVVTNFDEKSQVNEGWINGGFFVINPNFFDLLEDDNTILERKPLETAASLDELRAYKHEGFWQCMDTKRDKDILEKNSLSGNEPWKR